VTVPGGNQVAGNAVALLLIRAHARRGETLHFGKRCFDGALVGLDQTLILAENRHDRNRFGR
jgi:hypothetical protein